MRNLVFIVMLSAINIGILNAQQPEQVYSIARVYKPHEWYLKQAELWWKEIQKDKKNENAWYNFFMANRMASFEFDNGGNENKKYYEETNYLMKSDSIIAKAQLFIPNTFTSNYIVWRNEGASPKNFSYLEKAYKINPDFYGINGEMIVYYETQYNLEKRKEFNIKWSKINELSSNLLAYNYNVLMTMKPNAIILAFGDNDTFPLWMLQDVFGIRQDISVLNVHLLTIADYRKKIFETVTIPEFNKDYPDGSSEITEKEIVNYIVKNKPENHPLYIGLPAWKQYDEYSENLYLEGLALEYSTENVDNIALLKNNFENKYALDYIKNRFAYDVSDDIVNKVNINYLPGIFKLYEHYTLSGDLTNAWKMKELGLLIAQKGGQEWLDKASIIFK